MKIIFITIIVFLRMNIILLHCIIIFFFQSKINVASLGVRAIQKCLLSSGFSKTVDIQVSVNDFLT